jgi:hypothetical protein
MRKIAKLFRHTRKNNFSYANTLEKILKCKQKTNICNKSGIYQMKFMECLKKYIGQTGRNFSIRYKENIHDINSSNGKTGYANQILNTGHAYGTMTDTMNIITIGRKGKHLNTLEMKKTKNGRHTHRNI